MPITNGIQQWLAHYGVVPTQWLFPSPRIDIWDLFHNLPLSICVCHGFLRSLYKLLTLCWWLKFLWGPWSLMNLYIPAPVHPLYLWFTMYNKYLPKYSRQLWLNVSLPSWVLNVLHYPNTGESHSSQLSLASFSLLDWYVRSLKILSL